MSNSNQIEVKTYNYDDFTYVYENRYLYITITIINKTDHNIEVSFSLQPSGVLCEIIPRHEAIFCPDKKNGILPYATPVATSSFGVNPILIEKNSSSCGSLIFDKIDTTSDNFLVAECDDIIEKTFLNVSEMARK